MMTRTQPTARYEFLVAASLFAALVALVGCGESDSGASGTASNIGRSDLDASRREAPDLPVLPRDTLPDYVPPIADAWDGPKFDSFSLSFSDASSNRQPEISAFHSMLRSPCPQQLGRIYATNRSNLAATLELSLEDGAGLAFFREPLLLIEAGSTASIRIDFDCSHLADLHTTLRATLRNVYGQIEADFPLRVTITDIPAGACYNKADLAAIAAADPTPRAAASLANEACLAAGGLGDAALAACIDGALLSQSAISAECVGCYSQVAVCSRNRCAEACAEGYIPCVVCRVEHGCLAEFYACSALDTAVACGSQTCASPPEIGCADKNAVTYSGAGTCYDDLGQPICDYPIASKTPCLPEVPCVLGQCPADAKAYPYSPVASVVTKLTAAKEDCCFDVDGNGKPDNFAPLILSLLSDLVKVDALAKIQTAIEDGDLVILLEMAGFSNVSSSDEVTVQMLRGRALDPAETVKAGLGRFEVDLAASFSPATGLPQVSLGGSVVAGLLAAGPGVGSMKLQMRAAAGVGGNGIGLTLADGAVGGLISIYQAADSINAVANCACLNLPAGARAVRVSSQDPKRLRLECTSAVLNATPTCTADDPALCRAIDASGPFCVALKILPFEQDADGDGQKESMPLAFRFSAVSATIVGGY
ncbi:MAG: hypothetical protein R3F39_11720 [Myxococcota bacterium]